MCNSSSKDFHEAFPEAFGSLWSFFWLPAGIRLFTVLSTHVCQSVLPQHTFFSLSILLTYLCTQDTLSVVRGQLICIISIQLVYRHHQWSQEARRGLALRDYSTVRRFRTYDDKQKWKKMHTATQVDQSLLRTQRKERVFCLFVCFIQEMAWGRGKLDKEDALYTGSGEVRGVWQAEGKERASENSRSVQWHGGRHDVKGKRWPSTDKLLSRPSGFDLF